MNKNKRCLALFMGLTVGAASVLGGCASSSGNGTSSTASETIYGEISDINDGKITIEVGTLNQPSKPDEGSSTDGSASGTSDSADSNAADASSGENTASSDRSSNSSDSSKDTSGKSSDSSDSSTNSSGQNSDSSDSSTNSSGQNSDSSDSSTNSSGQNSDSSDKESNGAPSLLEKTGEEKEITVDSDTEIVKETQQGGPQGQEDGQAPSGNQPPAKPSDDSSSSDSQSDGNSNSGNQPPAMPSGDSSNSDSQPPAMPSGDSNNSDSQPPAKPSGDSNSSDSQSGGNESDDSSASDSQPSGESSQASDESTDNASAGSSGNTQESSQETNSDLSLSDLSEGDIVGITFDEDGNVETITILMSSSDQNGPGGAQGPGGGGQSQAPDSYDAVKEYTSDTTLTDLSVTSDGTDENGIHAYNGAAVNLSNLHLTRNSSDSQGGDSSSFYGVGAAVLESDGVLYLKNSTITTSAKGAAGIFAYGDGTVYAADTTISTTEDTSGGIHAAGGGTFYAWDLDVTTSGESSAAIRSDRGGGTMVVDGGTYTSNGTGSPAIYSTADIAVNDATLTANGSEAICIEGLNSIHLFDSDLTGNMSDNSQNDCTWNVILYQSMSGDSEVGNSTFEMDGGSLTAKNGGMFYTTNTESTITLSDVDITYADENDFFLKCTGNSNQRGWGTSGANGADCLFTAINQEMKGDIIWDSISQLDFYMTKNSTLTGAVTDDESNAGNGGDGYCNLYIEKGSTWVVTGDSTLSSLQCAGTITDAKGNTVTIKGSDGTVYVKGTSSYTITVDSYQDSTDVSGASSLSSWSDYEVSRPADL